MDFEFVFLNYLDFAETNTRMYDFIVSYNQAMQSAYNYFLAKKAFEQ